MLEYMYKQKSKKIVGPIVSSLIGNRYKYMNEDSQFLFYQNSVMKHIGHLPKRTAFIDESGGFGFDFSKSGTSEYYVVCAIVVNDFEIPTIEAKISGLQAKFFSGNELKSSSIGSNDKKRYNILNELTLIDFSIVVLIADKKKFIEKSALATYKRTFIKYLHKDLYETMYQYYPNLTIIEDEHGGREFQNGFKDYVYKHQPQKDLFNQYSFMFVNSKASNIVQMADIIAGSIRKQLECSTSINALKLFQNKINGKRIDFPRITEQFYKVRKQSSGFDRQVYSTAIKSANDYVGKYSKEGGDEDIRLRVLFLKHLIFRIQNIGDEFIYSKIIIDYLDELSKTKITRNYLYRKIIAPLRDDGVLIASSPSGYKIPTSVKDISIYINQTVSVVGPMLSRVEICRDLLKATTDEAFDILDDPSLQRYKIFCDIKKQN